MKDMALETFSARTLQNRSVLGVFLMIIGIALYGISDAFIKHFIETYSVYQTSFLRSSMRLIPLCMAVFFQGGFKQIFATKVIGWHGARLLVSLAYTYSFMYAFSIASLTTVYAVGYSSAFFMIFLSALLLKEKVGKEKWFAVCVGLIGVLIATRISHGIFEFSALVILMGAFLGALNKVLMRKLATTEHSLAIAIYPNLMMVLVSLPFILNDWTVMSWYDVAVFFFIGLVTAGGQYAIAQALRFAQGSTLAPIDYSSFFWVIAIDCLWWMKHPDQYTLWGAALIIGSNLYILYRTKIEETKEICYDK